MQNNLPYHNRIAKRLGLPIFLPGDHQFDYLGGQSAHVEIEYTWLAIIKEKDQVDQIVALSKSGSLVAVHLLVHEEEKDKENSTIAEVAVDAVQKIVTREDFEVTKCDISGVKGPSYELFYHSESLDRHMSFPEDIAGPCSEIKKAIITMAKDIAYRSGKSMLIEASKRLR